MTDFDFFDITKISLKEKNRAKIESLLSRKLRELNDLLASENQDEIRNEIQAKIKFLENMREKIFDGKKISRFYSDMVKDKTDEIKRRLQARILLEKNSRRGKSLIVTNGKIRRTLNNNQEYGIALNSDDIKEAYENNGFTVKNISPLSAMPEIPKMCENIHKNLEILRGKINNEINTLHSDRYNADFVRDLYSFTAYISGDINNFAEYKNYSAGQLKSKLEPYLTLYAEAQSGTIEKLELTIAQSAVSYIFNSEAHRSGYDSYILIKQPELEELFNNMSGLLESDLRDPDIAELCIRKIAEVFGDYDTALAIYNDKAKLINNPYIPDKAVFMVKCAHCQAVCEFSSLKDAQSLNKCTNCGEKIYKSCPSCKKPVLFSLNKCPECGYVFPDVDRFNKFIVMAENALRNNNFSESKNLLANARIADSTEQVKTKELEARITKLEDEYNRPLKKLNELISELKFEEALKYSESLSISRPDIDISSQIRTINKILSECRTKFESAKDNISRVNASLDILAKCIDFSAALNFLEVNPPSPCKFLNAVSDDENTSILLSWDATGEREIKYLLVRKKGTRPPLNNKDGEIIINNSEILSFKDKNIEPGIIYSYSLFACRRGRPSQPVSVSKAVLAKISDIEYSQKDNIIYLSWKTPKNCSGVRVSYQYEGIERVISENAINSITLDDVKLNGRYIFYLNAVYPGLGYSVKEKYEVIPTKKIKDFKIISRHVKDNIYEFSWDLNESGIDLQILSGSNVIKRIRSEMRSCQINLQENNYHVIKASVNSGGEVKDSINKIEINTYIPPLINERKTEIQEINNFSANTLENKIKISLFTEGKIPDNLKEYICFVKSDDNWPSEKDALNKDSGGIIISAAGNNIEILFNAGNFEKIFLSIFAVYHVNGVDIVSAPYRKIFNRPLTADLFWKVYKPMFRRNYRLDIRIHANRQLNHIPGLILCASSDGMPINSPGANNAVKILEISPQENINSDSEKITASFEISGSLTRKQRVNLFVTENSPGENFIIKWESDFTGAV